LQLLGFGVKRDNTLRRRCLDAEFWARAATATLPRKIQDLWRRVVNLVM
jgi:hypothetical protein